MRTRNLLFVVVAIFPLTVGAQAPTPAPTDAAAKGTSIGTVISKAIDTALPSFSGLVSTIFGIFKPKENSDQSKAVTDAVNKATADFKKNLQSKFATIAPFGTQLDTLGPFIQYGFRASVDLASLQEYLTLHPAPPPESWAKDILPMWSGIKAELDSIPFQQNDVLSKVVDKNLQLLLIGVLDAKNITSKKAESYANAKSVGQFQKELSNLSTALDTLHVVARLQLRAMSDEVTTLTDWAKGTGQSARVMPENIKVDRDRAAKILQDLKN
jgi:hypothetical protein